MLLTVNTVYIAICLTSFVLPVMGSDIVFTSNPTTIKELLTDQLKLRCSLKDSATSVVVGKRNLLDDVKSESASSDVSFVQSISIAKGNDDIASVTEHLKAQVFDNSTSIHVSGQVSASGGGRGFLEVSWEKPGSAQSGSYECVISGVDQRGHLYTFRKSLDVSYVDELSLNDVINVIHQLKLQNDLLVANNSLLNASIAGLKATIADLNNKLNTRVVFTAILDHQVNVSTGAVVVFNRVQTSTGGGYNSRTGIFTCPIPGYYIFHLQLLGQSDQVAELCINHNMICVTSAWAGANLDEQTGSATITLLLKKGDEVKVTGLTTSYVGGNQNSLTSFSGHLIALV